ncbi:MAG: DciA family protein [Acidimicrobiia bacterium]
MNRPRSSDDDDDLVPFSRALDSVMRSLSGVSARAARSVFEEWDDAVGEAIARHARPVSLDDGVLVVAVDEPGWATQLRFLQTTIVERLSAVSGSGVVRSIEVRVRR